MAGMKNEDRDLLLRCVNFCDKIDSYSLLLGLQQSEIEVFKDEHKMLAFGISNTGKYQSFATSFAQCQIDNLRISFSHLAQACKNSDKYTIVIGYDLGIEIPVYAFTWN